MSQKAAGHPGTERSALAAVLFSVTNLLVVFDALVVTVALPSGQHSFGLTTVDAQWLITGYVLPLGGPLLTGGPRR